MSHQHPLPRKSSPTAGAMLRHIHRWSMTSLLVAVMSMIMVDTLHAQSGWTLSSEPTIHVFSVASDNQGRVLAATQSGLLRSIDNGQSWTTTPMTSAAYTVSMGINGLAFASHFSAGAAGAVLSRSTDGGATWTPIGSHTRRARGVTFDAQGIPISIHADSLFRSTDDGETWWPLGREGFGSSFYDFQQLAAAPDGSLMLGNWGITGGLVYLSIDDGTSWQLIYHAGSDMLVLEITPAGTAFLAANDRFVRSLDGGETWTQVPGVTTPPTLMAIAENEIYIAADGIYRSTDEGDSWTRIADLPPLPSGARVTGLTVAINGDLVAGTTKGIFRLSGSSSVQTEELSAGRLAIHPNPMSGATRIELPSPVKRSCRVELFDMLGRSREIIAEPATPGTRSIVWNSADIPPGIYMLRVDLDGTSLSREIVVAR